MIDLEKLRERAEQLPKDFSSVSMWFNAGEALELLDHIAALEQEIQEQCRINGMGSEREAALLSKVTHLEKDAGRYRWLRDNCSKPWVTVDLGNDPEVWTTIDESIDTAMEAKHG